MTRFLSNGRYALGKQLGVGGMGAVYDGADLALTDRVAIKVAHDDHLGADIIARYMANELRAGRAIRHPNVVAILDGGSDASGSFIVMKRAWGIGLNVLCTQERFSVRRVAGIIDQLLAGLAAIHDAGFAHGDLKSDNVLVERRADGTDRVTIIDLGLASPLGTPANDNDEERCISGTPYYLAPELVLGGTKTVASDLYAVGVILYELLTGSLPFTGGSMLEILRKHIEDDVVPPSLRAPELDLGLALERVVLRALAKRPGERYATARDLRAALRGAVRVSRDALTVSPISATPARTDEHTRPDLPPRPRAVGTNPPPRGTCDTLLGAAVDVRDPVRRARRICG